MPDFADDLADRIDGTARLAAASEALAKLRRGEREVIAMCVCSGLDYSPAARALGVPVGTVRSRLSRARKKLQKLGRPPGRRAALQAAGNRGRSVGIRGTHRTAS